MVSSKDKGFEAESLGNPPSEQERKDLSYLPKYIAYKAALLREKMILTYMVGIMAFILVSYFVISRIEIAHLYSQLRSKEYILAPGVRDFTPVSPQSIPDAYVHDAASDFLSSLGNVNASNIVEEYSGLKRFMSEEFKIKFDVQTREWIRQVQAEDLAQIVKMKNIDILTNEQGAYHVTAYGRADFYAAGQYLGNEEQVIEMNLKLMPPDPGKRWYLQIESLTWSKLDAFKAKADLQNHEKEDKQ
jgi:hypothetical protein